jgi:hypothetical protein
VSAPRAKAARTWSLTTRERVALSLPPGVLDDHLSYMRQRGLSSVYISSRRCKLARLGAALPVPILNANAAWRESLTVTSNVVLYYVSHVREFYAWAVDTGLIGARNCRFPAVSGACPRPMPLTAGSGCGSC